MARQTVTNSEAIPDYLELTTNQLLEAYGAGRHIPGSGSAAALSALIAIELMRTVCKLTLQKPKYSQVHKELELIMDSLEKDYKPRMRELFAEDISIFNLVSTNRILRDGAVTPAERNRYSRSALLHQRAATTIPLEISRLALAMLPFAITIFDRGFKSARGDSGVAISNLLSAISGSLFIVFLNLKPFRRGKWSRETQRLAEQVAGEFARSQRQAFAKVLELYEEGLLEEEKQLVLNFP